jgi:hypothetical protein
VNRDLGAALKRAAQRTGEQAPSVRGSDWAGAVVTAVNADGTVDAGDLEDVRCMETYIQPAVGDLIYITQSSSGNWLAWGRAATSDDPVGGIRVARKTTDTARTSTATTAADPQLLFTVRAGAVYLLDGWIKYTADPAADINVDWDIPAGSLGEWTGAGASIDTAAAANGYSVQLAANDVESARSFGGAGTGSNLTLDIKGTLRVGATAGTYQLLWAQRVSNAAATTVYADSWLRLHRVA